MAIGAGCGDIGDLMIWILGVIIICLVAADTGICCNGIISVMALVAVSRYMGAGKCIIGIVNSEGGRFPSEVGSMAIGTGCRNVGRLVIRICGGIVI